MSFECCQGGSEPAEPMEESGTKFWASLSYDMENGRWVHPQGYGKTTAKISSLFFFFYTKTAILQRKWETENVLRSR
jgi:hypothetical protein